MMPTRTDRDSPCECADWLHGWTLTAIHDAARIAVRQLRGYGADHHSLAAWAWDGILDSLIDQHPSHRGTLITAGRLRALHHAERNARERGYRRDLREVDPDVGYPRWSMYWIVPQLRHVHHESTQDRLVEEIAARQVLQALSDEHRAVLVAVGAAGNLPRAAELLEISRKMLWRRYHAARAAFLALWHEGETPVQITPGTSIFRYSERVDQARCGTISGARWHRRRFEEVCQDCRDAQNAYKRAWKARRAEAGEAAC